jgi:hypothetical protein
MYATVQCLKSYRQVLDIHLLVPLTRELVQVLAAGVFDVATDSVVGSTKVTLCLELEISSEACFGAADVCVVAELVLHRPEQDAARVHVGLCDETACCEPQDVVVMCLTYNRSPVFNSRRTAMPSIILAAELPRNLLRGLRVPSMRMLCSGAMKK